MGFPFRQSGCGDRLRRCCLEYASGAGRSVLKVACFLEFARLLHVPSCVLMRLRTQRMNILAKRNGIKMAGREESAAPCGQSCERISTMKIPTPFIDQVFLCALRCQLQWTKKRSKHMLICFKASPLLTWMEHQRGKPLTTFRQSRPGVTTCKDTPKSASEDLVHWLKYQATTEAGGNAMHC